MIGLQPTYTLASNPPSAMRWEQYQQRLAQDWARLLASEASEDETKIQAFLEQHPCLVPGARSFPPSGHRPFPGALISQPRLQGFGLKVPDFMWIAFDSATIYPVLVEIETPHKRWFTKSGSMHSDFTAAFNQLTQWSAWLKNGANQQVFISSFGIPSDLVTHHRFHPQFVLVHGSRRETDSRKDLAQQRAESNHDPYYTMTFDRLTPQFDAHQYPSAVRDGAEYRLLAVPPTLHLGPANAADFALFSGRETAIDSCAWMEPERKEFLKGRLSYWDDWAKAGRAGFVRGGDWE